MSAGALGWTLRQVAVATSGVIVGDPARTIDAVITDSRSVTRGALFVAIAGERFDGHDFARVALDAGAAGVVVSTDRALEDVSPRVDVVDTLAALRDLGALRRSQLSMPVVAVTGSTGKTSVKDILEEVLPGAWASPASYNNEVGVPLTVLRTPDDAAYLVAEIGSRGAGDIAWLVPAVRPDVVVITNLGVVHLETFGTTEALANAKWELVEGLEPGGTAVLPYNEPRLARSHAGATVTFGDRDAADVWFDDIEVDGSGRASFTVHFGSRADRVKMLMAGRHQPWNAVAASAAALSLGVDIDIIVARLATATGSPGRMEIHHGSVTIVNDAYNANPDSMAAALETVAAMPGRQIAVVGLMAELGQMAASEHARLGALARELGFAAVIVVGEEPGLAEAAGAIARPVADAAEAWEVLDALVRDGDVVLVKASHAVGLETLALRLVEEATE